jgi:hypothetical protein
VFVSHSGDDAWVAEQIARRIGDCGAFAFLDLKHIAAGDNFKERIHEEISQCDELLALYTPWSVTRAWVAHEIGMAAGMSKRTVCVFYMVDTDDFKAREGGLGPLDGLNIVQLNNIDTYFQAVRKRVALENRVR